MAITALEVRSTVTHEETSDTAEMAALQTHRVDAAPRSALATVRKASSVSLSFGHGYAPPATGNTVPVTYEALGDNIHVTASATSIG